MKKTKFKALKRKILLPDNCHYFDLGESTDFYGTFSQFFRKHFPSETDFLFNFEMAYTPKVDAAEGLCWPVESINKEKYGAIAYRPKKWKINPG